MTATVPRTWVAGETVTAAELNTEIRDALTAILAAWTSYSPTVSGFTSVTLATTGSAWQQTGQTVHFRVQVSLVAVTTLGSSTITVALPVTASAGLPSQGVDVKVRLRTNAGVYVLGVGRILASGTTLSVLIPAPGGATPNLQTWTGAFPTGQVNGDAWTIEGTYEVA